MTASCVAITAARLASIASSQSAKKLSGSSATPSRDNNSYTTIFRTPYTSDWSHTSRRNITGRGGSIHTGLRPVHGIAQMRDTHTGGDRRIPEDDRCVREVVEQPHSCA